MRMYEEVASLPLLKFAWTRGRVAFVLIHLFSLITIAVSDGNLWALGIIAGVQVIFWSGNYKHRERLRKMPSNPNNHFNEITHEGTDFPIMAEPFGAPITDKYKWYMARWNASMAAAENAWFFRRDEQQKAFDAYLSDKRFDKFRK